MLRTRCEPPRQWLCRCCLSAELTQSNALVQPRTGALAHPDITHTGTPKRSDRDAGPRSYANLHKACADWGIFHKDILVGGAPVLPLRVQPNGRHRRSIAGPPVARHRGGLLPQQRASLAPFLQSHDGALSACWQGSIKLSQRLSRATRAGHEAHPCPISRLNRGERRRSGGIHAVLPVAAA